MKKIALFIQVQDRPSVSEIELPEGFSVGDLLESLKDLGIPVDAETSIFVGESDDHLDCKHLEHKCECRHGSRVHVCRCRRIACTVNFLEKSAQHSFAPGARIRAVKDWAVKHFHMNPNDAGEHVLQICGSSDRPTNDTVLQQLLKGHGCALCFDLVPETRVEG